MTLTSEDFEHCKCEVRRAMRETKGDVMLKQVLIVLLGVIGILMLGTHANAGCIPLAGGGQYCADWITGSQICLNSATGLGNIKDCLPGETCPFVTCSAYGTVGPGCDSTLDPNCDIDGIAFCQNPQQKFNPQGRSYAHSVMITGDEDITVENCTKNGRCRVNIPLEADCSDCCPKSWQFITFTARVFNAEACFCPDGSGESCSCVIERCEVDLTRYRPGDRIPYRCTPLDLAP